MEKLQRLATRTVKGMRGLYCEDRLRWLNFFSIERRLLRGDLIMAYMFQGQLDLPLEDFSEAPSGRDLQRHVFQLRRRRFNRARRGAAFSVRLPRSWKALPLVAVTAPTLVTLKCLLDDHWASIFPDAL